MRRLSDAIVVGLFLGALSTPLGLNIAGGDGGDAEAENRTLAAWPELDGTWDAVGRWGNRFGHWFDDHFGLRSDLIRWYGISRYDWLKTSPSPNVMVGKDQWLFYMEDGALDDFVNGSPLSEEELAEWRRLIVRAQKWTAARGITYLFTLPPDKYVIYPQYLPDTVRQLSPVSRTDQVITAATDTGAVLDVRQEMIAASKHERLFHVTDTHWNDRGAYVAYRQIVDTLHARLPAVPPAKARGEFEPATRILDGRDLAAMIGLKRVLKEQDLRLLPKKGRGFKVLVPENGYATGGDPVIITEIPGSSLPRAVIFRDSFASALAPLLSEHFSRAVYLWQNDFDAAVIEREKPDVVIHEIVGRHLYTVYPYPDLVPEP